MINAFKPRGLDKIEGITVSLNIMVYIENVFTKSTSCTIYLVEFKNRRHKPYNPIVDKDK